MSDYFKVKAITGEGATIYQIEGVLTDQKGYKAHRDSHVIAKTYDEAVMLFKAHHGSVEITKAFKLRADRYNQFSVLIDPSVIDEERPIKDESGQGD